MRSYERQCFFLQPIDPQPNGANHQQEYFEAKRHAANTTVERSASQPAKQISSESP